MGNGGTRRKNLFRVFHVAIFTRCLVLDAWADISEIQSNQCLLFVLVLGAYFFHTHLLWACFAPGTKGKTLSEARNMLVVLVLTFCSNSTRASGGPGLNACLGLERLE